MFNALNDHKHSFSSKYTCKGQFENELPLVSCPDTDEDEEYEDEEYEDEYPEDEKTTQFDWEYVSTSAPFYEDFGSHENDTVPFLEDFDSNRSTPSIEEHGKRNTSLLSEQFFGSDGQNDTAPFHEGFNFQANDTSLTSSAETGLFDDKDDSVGLRFGVITTKPGKGTCKGTLIVNLILLPETVKTFTISHRAPNIGRRFESAFRIFQVRNVGDCCYELYERPKFRGERRVVGPNYDGEPELRVMSVKKVEC